MNIPDDQEPKFDECYSCFNFGRARICRRCDAGEQFDPSDGPMPIDKVITND